MSKKSVCLVAVLFLFGLAGNCMAAIAFDAFSTAGSGTTAASTLAWSHTVGSGERQNAGG